MIKDPNSAKRHLSHQCLSGLVGSAWVKAESKHVAEIDP